MSSSAGGTQTDPKADDKTAAGKNAAALGGVKPTSSHAQTGSSSHHSGASVHSASHSGSHSIGVGPDTPHISSSKTSRDLTSGGESGNESDHDSRSSGVSSKSSPKTKLSRAQRDEQREESIKRTSEKVDNSAGFERQGIGVQTDLSLDPKKEYDIDFTQQK